jgi:CRP/FNR family cyclic AMP-dependent transcriptional regulator
MMGPDQDVWYSSISDRTSQKHFAAEEIIALQGEPIDFVGYVLAGKAKAVAYSENGDATWVGHFQAGEFLGHTSLLTNSPVRFEISAETDVDIIRVSVPVMQDLLSTEHGLNATLAKDLAARLDGMTSRLIEAFTLSTKGRICAELSRLSRIMGIMPENLIIRPSPVFVELAQRVNSTRETVSRTVSELQKKNIVTREPGALVILDPDALRRAIV